ncbi:hypothetical protein NDU88_006297 [Pleurodeles waltl]|uniref:Uncharacterized protein n=1 Tax=Pleurodeles waltl TaxID=8319 RepID=A0AAV7UL35_PLEWA|nr:hypothetical protein NDU88_006297 [Pleurodeles waltl]
MEWRPVGSMTGSDSGPCLVTANAAAEVAGPRRARLERVHPERGPVGLFEVGPLTPVYSPPGVVGPCAVGGDLGGLQFGDRALEEQSGLWRVTGPQRRTKTTRKGA